ncbi:hypothetical protein Q7O_001960 [Pectobacterium carotovorum subsp. carotovorum PCCS1]|nr:hypothetical protein [Pectobacterium carotovorum subsp. carotovorum PCCS1]
MRRKGLIDDRPYFITTPRDARRHDASLPITAISARFISAVIQHFC